MHVYTYPLGFVSLKFVALEWRLFGASVHSPEKYTCCTYIMRVVFSFLTGR